MIFVTVGTDLPFDRMMRVIDGWARHYARRDVFAQIGEGGWEPNKRRFDEAELIISHAGMGTILMALLRGKPILVMPKRASLGEHRSEHQVATARCMHELYGVQVAYDESQLVFMLNHLADFSPSIRIGPVASGPLVDSLRSFIFSRSGIRKAKTRAITKRP